MSLPLDGGGEVGVNASVTPKQNHSPKIFFVYLCRQAMMPRKTAGIWG
jgi:hypothetical protein